MQSALQLSDNADSHCGKYRQTHCHHPRLGNSQDTNLGHCWRCHCLVPGETRSIYSRKMSCYERRYPQIPRTMDDAASKTIRREEILLDQSYKLETLNN